MNPESNPGQLWAIVPAGGAGTRLWPLSRAAAPKFLHDLTDSGRTLLQATVDRLVPLVDDRVVVVTGVAHAAAVRHQLDLPDDRVVAEPTPRDSMPAIGLAAAMIERGDPEALVGSFAADQVIADGDAFAECVREAAAVAATGLLVTIGIEPTGPATGFGYIRAGEALPGFATARSVVEFVEKPDGATAREYLASGEYRWNAGMFVCRAGVLLELLGRHHPELVAGLRAIAAQPSRLADLWPGLTKIAIDHAIAEPASEAGLVAMVPGSFGWADIGDFAALSDELQGDGLKVLGDPELVIGHNSSGLVVPSSGRTVAVVGLENVVVVDTADAVLVMSREQAQDVKGIVESLKQSERTELL